MLTFLYVDNTFEYYDTDSLIGQFYKRWLQSRQPQFSLRVNHRSSSSNVDIVKIDINIVFGTLFILFIGALLDVCLMVYNS